jgi:PAS domain S-box-containing protein
MAVSIYETIVEKSDDGVFVAQDGEIVYTNPQLRNLTGYSKEELDGVPKTQIIGRVAKRSRLCRWYSQLRGHS